MDWRTRIVADPDVLVGKPVIEGTRIAVELVVGLLAAGDSTRQILDRFQASADMRRCPARRDSPHGTPVSGAGHAR